MFQVFAIIIAFAVSAVAVVMTVRAVRSMLGVIKQGQPAPGRSGDPVGRTVTMLKETVGHTRMLQWTWIGILHWFAFAAFIYLSTAVAAAFPQLFDPEWTIPVIGKWFVYEWAAEILGLLGTLGIIPLIVYRLTHMPADQGRKTRFFGSTMWQAFFVEFMVLLESSAILFIRGAEYNLGKAHGEEHAEAFHFPISQFFGHLYPTGQDSIGTLENIIIVIAVIKIVSAMIWLMVISANLTMGVAWHRFTAWFNIWFKREESGRTALGAVKPLTSNGKAITLDDIDDLDEDAVLGAGSIEDFSWKGILDFTTCTECGRCQSQCPAWNTEKPLSPKLLMMGLRTAAYEKAAGGPERTLVGKTEVDSEIGQTTAVTDWFYNPEGADFVIDEDVLWSCTSCGACVQQCPVDIEHVDHIIDMRRYQVLVESNFPSELNGLFKGLENKGNPWNMSPNARMDWAKDLPFEVKVVGESIESLDEVDWLFWVGCAGAYEDRAKKTTRAVAELLDMAGVSFGVLGNGETCTGDPARRAGNEFVFQGLAQQNAETFKEYKVKKVVSTCAHCFNTLRNEYQEFGVELEVVHHTQLLNRLVREGKLTPVTSGAGAQKRSITYHDPCYIGRHNGVYSPPRELLQVLPGAEFVEMERNSERSFCCGAGGARMWMEETLGERININRTNEAINTGADQIAVGCPFCRVMLSDGLTSAQAKGEAHEAVEVLDVAQMLLASVKGEQATKLAPGEGERATVTAGTASSAALAERLEAANAMAAELAGTATATLVEERPPAPAPAEKKPEPAPEAKAAPTEQPTEPATEQQAEPATSSGGGSSLFDSPSSGGGSSLFDAPAEAAKEEKPAAPAASSGDSGGSLFDNPGSLFDTPADKPAEKSAETPAATAEPASKPSSGSLFDEGSSLFDAPAPAAEKPSAPKAEEAAAPKAEPKAEEPAAKAPATPATDLGSGGSLFDIAAPAETTPSAPEDSSEVEVRAPASLQTTEEPEPAAEEKPAPSVDLNAGGSLFDLPAPDPAPSGAEVTASASAVSNDEPVAAEPEAPSEAEAAPQIEDSPEVEAAPQVEDSSEVEVRAPASLETTEEPEPAAEEKPKPTSSGATNTPRTDVDINEGGSLFDL